ncbi:YkgJ family cysteine cluster protein [Chloracidobacterium sp. MS 40/45]|uniref:YkgJ family cysteine cluster protein n=1 Tax=Chloracidobacterium aggregatum TaxID=2851959 RepID=UPI001B8B40F9|nr:YkgJ family cysteine cluster protein [Chloracidobacterium aggregatum]QUV99508.1 YkgJ family cysteine cluster protein [Chloracidobacterium sp. MS 40/45]
MSEALPSTEPSPETAPHAAYRQLLADIERFAAVLRQRFPASITCRLGCTGCCQQHLTVLPIEAAALREYVARLDAPTRARLRQQAQAAREQEMAPMPTTPAVPCPALVDGACAVYPARPVLCRTHGFPLLYLDEDDPTGGILDVCPLNFTDDTATITHRDVFDMTVVNTRLVAASLAFDPTGGRQFMADIILAATASETPLPEGQA